MLSGAIENRMRESKMNVGRIGCLNQHASRLAIVCSNDDGIFLFLLTRTRWNFGDGVAHGACHRMLSTNRSYIYSVQLSVSKNTVGKPEDEAKLSIRDRQQESIFALVYVYLFSFAISLDHFSRPCGFFIYPIDSIKSRYVRSLQLFFTIPYSKVNRYTSNLLVFP